LDRRRYWDSVEFIYFPFYAYEEILATFGDRGKAHARCGLGYEIPEGRDVLVEPAADEV
jgi:hypothetical protein